MSVKTGTKTWDDRPREANANRGSSGQTMSADQKEKNFGGDDLGAILNKISDPNYVDESHIVRGVGNAKMDKDAFLKMMLAQLKNQDPTNPLKSHEMAAQMAQFSSVEQMANMNKSLEDIRDAQKSTHTYQVLDYLGKAVSGDSSKLIRVKNDLDHDVSFELPSDATDVKIKVRNEQ
ncbi:MAG: flagellar hook capping FlgD N-terminal domain-containing protein, partial [Bdellovibrio sp.]